MCEEEISAIQRCRRGSREAFEFFVHKYMKDAYFIALGLVGNREDAMDLSQEAFVQAYRHIKHIKTDRRFFPWFYQILKNLCFSHLRRRRVRQTTSLDDPDYQEVSAPDDYFSPDEVAKKTS